MSATGAGRHGWLKHFLHGLETDPVLQYKVHIWAVRVWLVTMVAVAVVFTYAQGFWAKASVLFLVEISLYANLATDYGAASAAEAAGGLPGTGLPAIPLDTSGTSAHYDQQTQIRDLIARNNELTETIATQTCLLDEIHKHVSALAPQAGDFPPGSLHLPVMCTCQFTGMRTCHCSRCHETFASPNSFDWHQKMFPPYGPVCVAPELVFRRDGSRVLFRDARGYWRERRPDLPPIAEVMKSRAA